MYFIDFIYPPYSFLTLIYEDVETKEYKWLFDTSGSIHGDRFRNDNGNKYTLIIREETKKLMEAIINLRPDGNLLVLGSQGLFLY